MRYLFILINMHKRVWSGVVLANFHILLLRELSPLEFFNSKFNSIEFSNRIFNSKSYRGRKTEPFLSTRLTHLAISLLSSFFQGFLICVGEILIKMAHKEKFLARMCFLKIILMLRILF